VSYHAANTQLELFAMKQFFIMALAFTLPFFSLSRPCHAEEHGFSLGLRGGSLQFTGGDSWHQDNLELEMANTLSYGISGSYRFNNRFGIEVTLEQYKDADGDVENVPTGSPNVSNIAQTFITLSPKLLWPTGTRITPYIAAGIAYYFNQFNRETYFHQAYSQMALEDSWGIQASVGTDIRITTSLVLSLDLRYQYTEPSFKWTRRADNVAGKDKFTLAGLMTGVGIKYMF